MTRLHQAGAAQAATLAHTPRTSSLVAIGNQLHNETCLAFSEQRLDRTHRTGAPPDLDALSDFQRPLIAQMPSRHHLVAAPNLISIASSRHS